MMIVIVLLGLCTALFVGSFLSKRRFGVLALGLTAGAIISPIWSDTASFVVSSTGLVREGPLVMAIASSALILIPAVLFMFHGYSYKHIIGRVVGSVLFMLLAVAFLVEPVGSALTLTGPAGNVYQWFASHHELIISFGVVFAVVDFLLSRTAHKTNKGRH